MKKSGRIPKAVRPEEFKLLIQKVPTKDLIARVSFLLAYGSGLRVSEVLRVEDEDIKDHTIFIQESKYGVERIVPKPKGWKNVFHSEIPLQTTART